MSKPKAYTPLQGYKYQILCRNQAYNGREWEHCEHAIDKAHKDYLLKNYKEAYGIGWEFNVILLPKKYHKNF